MSKVSVRAKVDFILEMIENIEKRARTIE